MGIFCYPRWVCIVFDKFASFVSGIDTMKFEDGRGNVCELSMIIIVSLVWVKVGDEGTLLVCPSQLTRTNLVTKWGNRLL